MKVIVNSDKELVAKIKQQLKDNDGYCPCRAKRTLANKCMCEEFRGQLADPSWYGECHCGLYIKVDDR